MSGSGKTVRCGLVGVLLVLGSFGCHHQAKNLGDTAGTEPGEAVPDLPVLLEVENRNWSDVIIYLLVDGKRYRFLQVGAAKDVSKEIPRAQQGTMGMFRFLVHRIGSREEHLTEQVSVRTGRTIRLTLESNLRRSSIAVF